MSELCLHLSGSEMGALTPELSCKAERYRGGPVDLRLDANDVASLRWLWEDPLVHLYDPGSGRRAQAQRAVESIGAALGRAFVASDNMRRLFERVLASGDETRVLVSSEYAPALDLPWELARTPDAGDLSSLVGGVARRRENLSRPPVRTAEGPLRVLLVVSRPAAADDVEYQAIAARLLARLNGRAEVNLVRPGTFPAFEQMVEGGGWDLVHYDGHGSAGTLQFENAMIGADRIGRTLRRSGVPVFVLNACQSAVCAVDLAGDEPGESDSVARVLVDTGAAAVVAMGASVRVASAVTFFDRFYQELADGATLNQACHRARRAIEAGEGHGPLDWAIPVLYLREDGAPFEGRAGVSPELSDLLAPSRPRTAAPPGIFVGRDGDLYTLDRALDASHRVLIHGLGGVGKTTLVEHLLYWRERTGGADRTACFSFRGAPPLAELAQKLQDEAVATRPEAEEQFQSPSWTERPPGDRLLALARVLSADAGCTRLFLFDAVEVLSGYPDVGSGPYGDDDRSLFREFLLVLGSPACKVVLTSRRDEIELLREDVRRVWLRGVRGRDRLLMLLAFSEAFAADRPLRSALVDGGQKLLLDDLLRALGGHPLATRVAAYGLRDRPLDDVLASIQGKSAPIRLPVPARGIRSENLEQVVEEMLRCLPDERRPALGVLGLFSGAFEEREFLSLVSHPDFPAGVLPDASETGVRQVVADAHRLGLLGPAEGGSGAWEVIPGAQGALEQLWKENVGPETATAVERHLLRYWSAAARRASEALHSRNGARGAVQFASREEGNLRRALGLAERYEEWEAAHSLLALLLELWPMRGRGGEAGKLRDEWLRTVGGPGGQPQTSDEAMLRLWCLLSGAVPSHDAQAGRPDEALARARTMVELAQDNPSAFPDLLASAYTQLGRVERGRDNLADAEKWYSLARDLEEQAQNRGGLAQAYHQLGRVELERGNLDAAERLYRQSLQIRQQLGDDPGMADSYYRLGKIELERGNLESADAWFRKSLEIDELLGNLMGLANTYHQLGKLAQVLADTYRQAGNPAQARDQLDVAEAWYRKGVAIDGALGDRPGMSTSYYQLSVLEAARDNLKSAEAWCRKSLSISQELASRSGMARSYTQLSVVLARRGDHERSREASRRAMLSLADLARLDGSAAARDLRALYDTVGNEEEFLRIWTEANPDPELAGKVAAFVSRWRSPQPG